MKFQGGESAVQRLMQAYGFTMKKQLGDHLGAGTGTISTWVKRDYFPGEAIVRCALETGADLNWLATGELSSHVEDRSINSLTGLLSMPHKLLKNGTLHDNGLWHIEPSGLLEIPKKPLFVQTDIKGWIIECDFEIVTDGKWLLQRADVLTISDLVMLPESKWLIDSIIWPSQELSFIGKISSTINYGN
ncbi:phage repressor protein CI [Hafnia alvei]|uniref:phage repressor protein CI n=1 Tax=Hafnia alvei TaxID=569 RepID=UPI00345EB73D